MKQLVSCIGNGQTADPGRNHGRHQPSTGYRGTRQLNRTRFRPSARLQTVPFSWSQVVVPGSENNEPVVIVRDVCKEFRREQLTIPCPEWHESGARSRGLPGAMGPSEDPGKTTLLNLIAGLHRPTSGQVIVCGQDLGNTSEGEGGAGDHVISASSFSCII